jgi:uncharacterized membrane protein YphA (DoxX/SURF4 family)
MAVAGARLDRGADALASLGRLLFVLAIVALGCETLVCARDAGTIPVLPWLPPIPWLAYAFAAVQIACGIGLLFERTLRVSAILLGGMLFAAAVILDVPRYLAHIGDIPLRTLVFEPLSLACIAWLLTEPGDMPGWLIETSRYLLALSLVVFGVDHFLGLGVIAPLVPSWIPWHVFWVVFFGVGLIAGGLSLALHRLDRAAAVSVGLMFAIWVITLHVPRTLGYYGIPGAISDPNEWSSLFIAVALWGGPWALIRTLAPGANRSMARAGRRPHAAAL